MPRILLFFSIGFAIVSSLSAEEDKTDAPLPDLKEIVVAGPYCGIYSLYACLDAFSKQPPIEELLTPEYVGSFRGSTAEELIKAAEKYGLHGKCYANVTWRQLQNAKQPMILHFRGGSHSDFNHWVAFLGMEGKHARIIDVPHELAYFSLAEVLAHWDGVAVLISDEPVRDEMVWEARLDYFGVVLFLLGGVFVLKTIFRPENIALTTAPNRREFLRHTALQTGMLLTFIGISALAFHAVSEIGFLKNPSAVAEVARRYHAVDVPEIPLNEMPKVIEQKEITLYDARYHRDYRLGTIPGATSFPIDSDLATRKKILQGIDKATKIVVFCQSAGCGYADDVASFLKFNGYRNVSIYRGGFREWKATRPEQISKS